MAIAGFERDLSQPTPMSTATATQSQGGLQSLLPTGGGIGGALAGAGAGAAIGSVVPVVGTGIGAILGAILGGTAGSAAGKVGQNKIEGKKLTEGVGKEALIGGLTSLPITSGLKVLRAGGQLAKGAVTGVSGKEAAKLSLTEAGQRAIPKRAKNLQAKVSQELEGLGGPQSGVLSKVLNPVDKATSSLLKLTPSATQKLLDSGVDPARLAQRAAQFGGSAEDIIGTTGKGGPLQATIKGLEDGIQTTAKTAGKNIKIDASDIIKGLEKEAKTIRKELGGGARLTQINKVIADAKSKYKNGVTVDQALRTLRTATAQFGKSILDDSGDAVIRAAQKLEANTLRDLLKGRFPSIAKGLDDQSELIQLREILQRARAVDKTGGFKASKLDLTRPGTIIDPVLNSKAVSRGVLSRAAKKNPAFVDNTAKTLGAGLIGTTARESLLGARPSIQESPEMIPEVQAPTYASSLGAEYALPTGYTSSLGVESLGDSSPSASTNPFGSDNIQQLILQDLQTGGKNVQTLLKLYETFGQSATEKPLTATQATRAASAQNALNDIPLLLESIESGKLGAKKAIPGASTSLGRRILGTEDLDSALFNIADNILRARSGAAAPEAEVKRFVDTFLPGPLDSEEAKINKLNRAVRELQGYLNPQAAIGDTLEDVVGA